ncbi:MAG: PTS transporter subunit EIIC [Mycoplasmatales bacterium]|nr:PTS transporter subunit EIIC [Mycoplasmatales bacterium]
MKASKARSNKKPGIGKKIMTNLSRVGKSLLFPTAMLPVAAILLRIGAQVPSGTEFSSFVHEILSAGGNAIFGTLPILFAIGVGFGLSKDSRGEAAIAAFATMALIMILMSSNDKPTFGGADIVNVFYGKLKLAGGEANGFHGVFGGSYNSILAGNVLNGVIVGSFVAYIYNKFNGIELPSILGFFSGRRLIPVLAILGGIIFGVIYAAVFPWIGYGLFKFSELLGQGTGNRYSKSAIMGVYGFVNRLCIPFGLHHIPNTLFWFQLGDFETVTGEVVQGDINGFLKGVPAGNTAGTFTSGFFPIMMFGLPALAVAFWFNADGDVQKKRVASLLFGSALVSFFTGITEPIEFSFMFMAPVLYGMHAILTGLFGFITGLFGIQIGFGFSAGLIDFALSIPKSMDIIHANYADGSVQAIMANPGWLFPIGLLAATTYFSLATLLIRKFHVSAPGRGDNKLGAANEEEGSDEIAEGDNKYTKDAKAILEGIGGPKNISSLEWCATRLRFTLKDQGIVDEAKIKATMAMGVIKVGGNGYQVIIGPKVEMMGEEIKRQL